MPKRRSDELAAIDEVMPLVDRFNELEHAQRLIFLDMVDPLPEEVAPGKKSQKKTGKSAPRKIQHCAVCDWTKRAALHKDTSRDDYHEFVLSQPEPNKSNEKPATKSPRASGMAAQLKERREQREVVTTKDDGDDRCRYQLSYGDCWLLPDDNIHHLKTHPDYHEFDAGKSSASPAPAPSPTNGAASASERSTRRSAPPSTPESDGGEERSALSSTVVSETGLDDVSSVHHAGD